MTKKPPPKHAADYDLWAAEKASKPAKLPDAALPEGTFRVTDHRAQLWEPAGPVQCAACGASDWWRDKPGGAWRCRPCNPAPSGMEREAFRLAFRGDARALDRASQAGGVWLMSKRLDGVPMKAWTVEQWLAFVAGVCEGYVKP